MKQHRNQPLNSHPAAHLGLCSQRSLPPPAARASRGRGTAAGRQGRALAAASIADCVLLCLPAGIEQGGGKGVVGGGHQTGACKRVSGRGGGGGRGRRSLDSAAPRSPCSTIGSSGNVAAAASCRRALVARGPPSCSRRASQGYCTWCGEEAQRQHRILGAPPA